MAKQKIDQGVTLIATNSEFTGDIKFADQLYVCLLYTSPSPRD